MYRKMPHAIRPAFKVLATPSEGFGDAGNVLLLRNWNAYMHLVAEASYKPEEREPKWRNACYELGKFSGLLQAAAVTAFVYGREVRQPHHTLREWQWRDGTLDVSYFIPANAADMRPDRQIAPMIHIADGNSYVADQASGTLTPSKWMGRIVNAVPYASLHLEKRRKEVFGLKQN